MRRRSDDLDGLLYTQAGLGGPFDPFRVDWAAVESYLAPGFVWSDNSLVRSRHTPGRAVDDLGVHLALTLLALVAVER
jgi:hypothetical protein